MINQLKLSSYTLFIGGFLFAVIIGRLCGEWFVEHYLIKLPTLLQNPMLAFFCVAIPIGLYINPYENCHLWAKLIDNKLASGYEKYSSIAPINVGLLVGFFSAWTSPSKAMIDFLFG